MHNTPKTNRHITLLASLGSTLEYYDFIIYGMMATYLSAVFFPPQNPTTAVLGTFLIFAVGYFARPLGGTVIGMVGDHLGRRPAFLISTTLMAASTLLIAFLPSYESMGAFSGLLLVFFRIIQGVSFGGELPGAMTIVGEFSLENRRGRKTSLVIASTSLGALLASGILYLLSTAFSKEDIIAWAWRLPFLGGGILGLLLLIARNTIQETPAFQSPQATPRIHDSLITLLHQHEFSLLRGIGLTAFMAALILTNLHFPLYIPKYFGYEPKDVFFATTVSLVVSVLILPFMGMFADIFRNKTTPLRWTCVSFIVLSTPSYFLLTWGSMTSLIAFLSIQQLFIALYVSCVFPILIRIFPPEVRYTGIALCYNLTWAAMATLPMAYIALLAYTGDPWIIPLVLSCIAGLSYIASCGMNKTPVENALNQNEESLVKLDQVG